MKNALCLFISLLPFILAPSSLIAVDANKEKDIIRLFEVMHSDDREKQMITMMLQMILDVRHRNNPAIPEKFWQDSQKILSEELFNSLDEIDKAKIVIYDHHYSDEEIKQITAFYETPLGQKVLKETPAITSEAFAVGKVWGNEVGKRAGARLKELAKKKGYTI